MNDADPAVEIWLPTLQNARSQGLELPEGEPSEIHKMAALIVIAGAVRRESWDEVLDERRAVHVASHEPPPAPVDYVARSHAWIVGPVAGKPGRLRVRHTNEVPISMCELYAPTLPIVYSFEGALEKFAEVGTEPPDALRCLDLRPRNQGGSAYRGGGKLQAADFHGFAFGDALEHGETGVDRLCAKGTAYLLNVRAFAWPFLWLRYPHHDHLHEVIVAPARRGGLRMVVAPA
ncbi:MAG: hypothetical protein HY898_31905 [Deltaproteobacteria bacterium]|nr:hypothetical protein [Deltaproteobacteria bacterium]